MLCDVHIPVNKGSDQDYCDYHTDQNADFTENPERKTKDIRIMLRIRSVYHVKIQDHQNRKDTKGSNGNPEFFCSLDKTLIRLNLRKLIIAAIRIYFSFSHM